MPGLRRFLAPASIVGVVLLFNGVTPASVLGGVDRMFFGLASDDTAAAYLAAPTPRRQRFYADLCKGGVCLPPQAWSCGFTLEHVELDPIKECFSAAVQRVAPLTRLGDLRMACGLRYAERRIWPQTEYDDRSCRHFGGTWGVLPRSPLAY